MHGVTVDQLVDSTRLLGDGDAMRARIAEDGYVFFRGLLDPTEVGTVGAAILGQLQADGWTEPGRDPVTAPPVAPVRQYGWPTCSGTGPTRGIVLNPQLNRIAHRSRLADTMRDLLGPSGFCYPLRIPRHRVPELVCASATRELRPQGLSQRARHVHVLVPFDTYRPNSRLALYPAPRTARVAPRALDRLPDQWVTTDYEPGDVLVFHCLPRTWPLPVPVAKRMRLSQYSLQLAAPAGAASVLVIGPTGAEHRLSCPPPLPW